MIGSNLVTKRMQAYAGNYTSRYGKITEITVHHCAGIMSIDDLGRLWQRVGREGSSHYGVSGTQIGQYVSEDDIAWTNSHWASNCRAVTIETSNSGGAPGRWLMIRCKPSSSWGQTLHGATACTLLCWARH